MSPVMVAPLVALAALLVMPGRLPERRPAPAVPVVATQSARATHVIIADRTARLATDAGGRIVAWVLHVP